MAKLALPVQMFKLRMWDEHVHFVPAQGLQGEPFSGRGVDLRAEAAREAFRQAEPLFDVLRDVEPQIRIRSLSVDVPRARLLATLHPDDPKERPRVIRIDQGPMFDRVLGASAAVQAYLGHQGREALERRV